MDSQTRPGRRTRVVNGYDNQLGQGHTWQGNTPRSQRALEDITWDRVIRGRVWFLGDFNAHSPIWNLHCRNRKNAKPLEGLIEKFDLLLNNESGRTTRLVSNGISILDLALSTVELGFLILWEIPEDYPSLSDHELILLRWEDINHSLHSKMEATPTEWDIQGLIKSPDHLESAYMDWISRSKSRRLVDQISHKKDLDEEVYWIEKNLAEVLNTHAKILRVTFFSKRWWNAEVVEAKKTWAKGKREWGTVTPNKTKLKQARNLYYRIVRKAKRQCWQSFLQGEDKDLNPEQRESAKNRCWIDTAGRDRVVSIFVSRLISSFYLCRKVDFRH